MCSQASFDTVRQIVAGVLTTPRDACVEVHLVSVVLVSPSTVMNAMTQVEHGLGAPNSCCGVADYAKPQVVRLAEFATPISLAHRS